MTTTETPPPLIDFPCFFPLKIMGETQAIFTPTITALIQTFVPIFSEADIDTRTSKGGKYISLTCNVWVTSQAQLDDIYRSVSTHPLVKFAL